MANCLFGKVFEHPWQVMSRVRLISTRYKVQPAAELKRFVCFSVGRGSTELQSLESCCSVVIHHPIWDGVEPTPY